MPSTYVSIGMQCSVAEFLRDHGLRTQSLPFDWFLSHPMFIYTTFRKLLDDGEDPHVIAQWMLACPIRCVLRQVEHFLPHPNGDCHYNPDLRLVFPHDNVWDPEVHTKYARRLHRLKQLLVEEDIHLVYASPSSSETGNFTFNGKPIMDYNVYEVLQKLMELVCRHNPTCKLTIYDALQTDDPACLQHPHITLRRCEPSNHFVHLMKQMRPDHLTSKM